jgi:hypothetical protein
VKVVYIALHRLFFHPLAKYPGPFCGRITDWYSVYHIVKGDAHVNFYRLHEKYGKDKQTTTQVETPAYVINFLDLS